MVKIKDISVERLLGPRRDEVGLFFNLAEEGLCLSGTGVIISVHSLEDLKLLLR
jgi:hypothetical protein